MSFSRPPCRLLFAGLLVMGGRVAVGQTMRRVDLDPAGQEVAWGGYAPALSADGRFVAFESGDANLVAGDTNGRWDIFVHDRRTGITERVSVDGLGRQADGDSLSPAISADGRFVAFVSDATNLVPGDTNGWLDVFLHDRQTGSTLRASVDSRGREAPYTPCDDAVAISGDGQVVAFSTRFERVPTDPYFSQQVYVHDARTGKTDLMSVSDQGAHGNGESSDPAASFQGRFVAFQSLAANLVPADTNGCSDVFVRDRLLRRTTRISVDSSAAEGDADSEEPSVSADGRLVAFSSLATNLVAGDTNGVQDVFVHDRLTGVTTRVSVDSSGVEGDRRSYDPALSPDGRYVAFVSAARNLVPVDVSLYPDIFVHDRLTGITIRINESDTGLQANNRSRFPCLSAQGRFAAFDSIASCLVPNDRNGAFDVFVRGPALTLEVSPGTVPPGKIPFVTLTTWGGQPSGPVLLAVTRLGGASLFRPFARGSFDSQGEWTRSGTAPPGLRGTSLTLLGLGLAPGGRVESTNEETVVFE